MAAPSITSLFAQRVVVGVGDLGVSNNPTITLSTYALGSCVAVAAYDPVVKVGGLLHLMLPDSGISADKARTQPEMFADTGIPLLLRSLAGLRADLSRLRLFLAGGASVLCTNDTFKIGERNIHATHRLLAQHGLAVRYSALGGTLNRTVHLTVGTGAVMLRMPDANKSWSLG